MTIRSSHSRQWSMVLITIAAVAGAVNPAASDPRWGTPRAALGRLISVEVQVDRSWVPLHRAPGVWDRQYFAAEHGENYALRIRNRSDRRIGVLISVDGLNVVNGQRSSLSGHEPMYVLDAHETATIRGWRTSLDDIREFVFVDERRSYANRTGQANGDMGWIRVLAFEERSGWRRHLDDSRREVFPQGEPAPHDHKSSGGDAETQPPLAAPVPPGAQSKGGATQEMRGRDEYPGTGWGDRRRDRVRETWFEPQAHATDRIVLRYEYADALAELGIDVDGRRLGDRERGEWRFAQPPRR